jgi:hypothetical protein
VGTELALLGPMMNIAFFWLPIVLAHTAPVPATPEVIPAGAAWAQAVSRRADAGWHMRDLTSSHDGQGIEISLTLASKTKAERLSLRYQPESESFSDFSKAIVSLPTEARRYENEQELFEELRTSPPLAINYDCADFYLNFGSISVSLSQDDFSVPLWSSANRPGRALSRWLSAALADGELVDIRDEREDNGAQVVAKVVFVVETAEGVEEMTVELGEQGAPNFLSVEHSPGGSHWAGHPSSASLRALASSAAIRRLRFVAEGFEEAPELQISTAGQESLNLDLGAFSADEEECGC